MSADLDALLISLYVLVDDLLPARRRFGRPPRISDGEVIEHDAAEEAAQPDSVQLPKARQLHSGHTCQDRDAGCENGQCRQGWICDADGRRGDLQGIAAPIDAKNQDGILVLRARVARGAAASFSAAEASAALGA